jgi:hypothetical protein
MALLHFLLSANLTIKSYLSILLEGVHPKARISVAPR